MGSSGVGMVLGSRVSHNISNVFPSPEMHAQPTNTHPLYQIEQDQLLLVRTDHFGEKGCRFKRQVVLRPASKQRFILSMGTHGLEGEEVKGGVTSKVEMCRTTSKGTQQHTRVKNHTHQ